MDHHIPKVKSLLSQNDQKPVKSHRRMHSDGSATLRSRHYDESSNSETTTIDQDGVRKRDGFCLFDDSEENGTSDLNDPSADRSRESENRKYSHRRSASYHGYFSAQGLSEAAFSAVEKAEELVKNLIQQGWECVHHQKLPPWLRDNEFLLFGHRPQLDSFKECFRSIFRVHTETVNIWTHLIGFVFFLVLSISFLISPGLYSDWQGHLVVQIFFLSAILALGFSWLFHTLCCHSEYVGRLFNKLDYLGIALLIIGSSIPWLHYSFYCHPPYKMLYISALVVMGSLTVFVCTQDYFLKPKYRVARAFMFSGLGLSAVVPCTHYILMEGFWQAVDNSALGWVVLMAVLYITGAVIYAMRIPERFYPGVFDIWFQSHQIFHVFVLAAALVHFYGLTKITEYRLSKNICPT